MNQHERNTVQLGSVLVLGTLGMGFQFGRWPVWTAMPIVAGYLVWVIAYAEISLHTDGRRVSGALVTDSPQPVAQSEPAPAEEERAS